MGNSAAVDGADHFLARQGSEEKPEHSSRRNSRIEVVALRQIARTRL